MNYLFPLLGVVVLFLGLRFGMHFRRKDDFGSHLISTLILATTIVASAWLLYWNQR